jgi:hypothetical protein
LRKWLRRQAFRRALDSIRDVLTYQTDFALVSRPEHRRPKIPRRRHRRGDRRNHVTDRIDYADGSCR